MRCIILAAGRGSRLGELTEGRPKCMVELLGAPLIQWQVQSLRAAGAERIAVVRGYRGESLEGYGTDFFDNARWHDTSIVMSLAAAADWLREFPCIVSYSDIFYPAQAVRALTLSTAPIALTYDVNWHALWSRRFADPLADAETFKVDRNNFVMDIGRRADRLDEVAGQYMGLVKFTPVGWNWIASLLDDVGPAVAERLDMTSLLRRLVERGRRIEGVPFSGTWGEVDSPEDLALYHSMPDVAGMLQGRRT